MTPPTWAAAGPSAVEPPLQRAGGPMSPMMGKGGPGSNGGQDRSDLERFAKYFSIKCCQVIVQARLGQRIKCASKPMSTGADWFNLTIDDNEEILRETYRAISTTPIPGQPPLYVEISLKTPESTLILELWSLTFKPELQDPNIRILYTVYNRMALLLKSAISVTRVVPAYKLSRMKTADYIMCYNIYTSDQPLNKQEILGDDSKLVELGTVGTPFGGLCFELNYRTKLEIIVPANKLMIKSDHYGNTGAKEIQTLDGTPISVQPHGDLPSLEKPVSEPIPLKTGPIVGAFEPVSPPAQEEDDSSIPFSNLLKRSVKFKKLQDQQKAPAETNKEVSIPEQEVRVSDTSESSSSGGDRNPPTDFIMVDLKTPFGPSPTPIATGPGVGGPRSSGVLCDPISFFNEFKEAPLDLTSLDFNLPPASIDIETDIETFEESMGEYDDFVKKLCNNEDLGGSSSSGSGPRFPLEIPQPSSLN